MMDWFDRKPSKCDCFLPNLESCKSHDFPEGCYYGPQNSGYFIQQARASAKAEEASTPKKETRQSK